MTNVPETSARNMSRFMAVVSALCFLDLTKVLTVQCVMELMLIFTAVYLEMVDTGWSTEARTSQLFNRQSSPPGVRNDK